MRRAGHGGASAPRAGPAIGPAAGRAPDSRSRRALRVDKLTYATLEATLIEHAAGRAGDNVPVVRMIETPVADVEARAAALRSRLAEVGGLTVSIASTEATIGGGSTPGVTLPSRALAVEVAGRTPDDLAAALRGGVPPVIGRIADERLLLDLRSVDPREDDHLAEAVANAARAQNRA
ncbi:MAG: hypothetical protein F4X11_18250 [Acidobacteria bacterium]|nr:hypothetical protein [Acidobacteriota bacterium]